MDVFSPTPPEWIETATHAIHFCCPSCGASSTSAKAVWLDRRSPVFIDGRKRKWQEFYHCECSKVWWAWSNDRQPNEFADRQPIDRRDEDGGDFDNFFGYF